MELTMRNATGKREREEQDHDDEIAGVETKENRCILQAYDQQRRQRNKQQLLLFLDQYYCPAITDELLGRGVDSIPKLARIDDQGAVLRSLPEHMRTIVSLMIGRCRNLVLRANLKI